MVKICNETLIVTWFLVSLLLTCFSQISQKKENKKIVDMLQAVSDLEFFQAPLFILSSSCVCGYRIFY